MATLEEELRDLNSMDPEDAAWCDRFNVVERLLGAFNRLIAGNKYALSPWWDRRDGGRAKQLLVMYVDKYEEKYGDGTIDKQEGNQ